MNLFWVHVNSTDDILKIDDTRCLSQLKVAGIVLFVALVIALPLYIFVSEENKLTGILISSAILPAALVFSVVNAAQLPYRRIYIFDRKQGSYRFIESSFFKNDENAGKLDEIKRVTIEVTEYESSEYHSKSYGYQTFLVLDDFLTYDNSHLLPVGEESGNSRVTRKIGFAVADFLQLPRPIESI